MKSAKMNVGGLIGVVVFGGIAATVLFLTHDFTDGVGGANQIAMLAICVGGFAGNFLWGRFVKNSK